MDIDEEPNRIISGENDIQLQLICTMPTETISLGFLRLELTVWTAEETMTIFK